MFSAGTIYVIVAWAAVQAADIAFPAFGIPDWAMRALLVAAFAGFPVALVLAWVFDFTSHGIRITTPVEGAYPQGRRPPRWWVRPLVAAPLLALIVGGTAWLWTARLSHTGDTEFTSQTRPDELPVVAVLPLENLTGRKELAWTGAGIATLVRDDLAQSRYMAVVSATRTARLVSEYPDMQALFTHAADAGISHIVSGEVLRTPRGLTITSRITDLRRNVEIGANRREGLQPDEALSVSTAVASVIKQGLGLPGTEKVDVFAADFASRNITAYEAFIAGMENFLRFDYEAARTGFEAAVARAPDFAMARYRLAHTLASLGDTDGAVKQIDVAQQNSARLPDREKGYINAAGYYFRRQYPQAEKAYRDLLKQYPYETEARLLLLYVLMDQGRNEEALVEAESLAAQDPEDEVAWSAVGDLNLKLGHYDVADEALAKLVELSPTNPNAHYLLGDSRLFQAQYDEAAKQYQRALELDAAFGDATLRLAQIDVLRDRPQQAITRLQSMVATPAVSPSLRISAAFDLASLLRAEGHCDAADTALDRVHADISAEKVREALELARRARCRLDQGDVDGALRLAADAVVKSPGKATGYLFTRGLAEVAAGDPQALRRTTTALRGLAAPGETSDRREQKAADYLTGLMQLKLGDANQAVASLRKAVDAPGYEYDVYALALAKALAASGHARDARDVARQASERGPPADFRPDLELARREAAKLSRQLAG